jgi:phage terminase large subunit-like protein
VKLIVSSRGKMLRAEPVATVFEEKRAHIVGNMPKLESEMTMWLPGDPSPNRLDALVFAMTENGLGGAIKVLNRS